MTTSEWVAALFPAAEYLTRSARNSPNHGALSVISTTIEVKSLDWRNRNATRKSAVSITELAEVRAKILALIG
jgi:hypothetical protein